MTAITAEFFTDPLSPWCWQCEPITRKLKFRFGEDLEWIPRMSAFLPGSEASDHEPIGSEADDADDHRWMDTIEGPSLPVIDSFWHDNPPKSSRPACQVVASARDRDPVDAERLLRRMRESTFVEGNPPETHASIDELIRESGLDIGQSDDDEALTMDGERAREVASELEDGVSIVGAVETAAVGQLPEADEEDSAPMVAPPCLRLEQDGTVVLIDPRVGYDSLENAVRKLAPSLQSRRVGHMEQIIESISNRTSREIAEDFGEANINSKIKDYMKQFERAFIAEISFGVDASPTKTSRIVFQLEEASIVESIYDDEMAAWSWR